jgi:hypothetical protein
VRGEAFVFTSTIISSPTVLSDVFSHPFPFITNKFL